MRLNSNPARRQQYFQLSSQLAQMETTQFAPLLDNKAENAGWGRHQTLEIGDAKFFVKRVPLTELERQQMFSTQNLYALPTYYNYGIGSAGLGVWRELVAHIKTTNWVLSGEIENFPLLYHYRIIPFSGERPALDMAWHQRYIQHWGGSEQVGQYLLDRANAQHEMVLFLEYIPHTLQPWLLEHLDQVSRVLDDLQTTINFLRQNGIIHFDAHFYNMLTDGERVYLSDFGLVLDRNFALTTAESAFFDIHTDYDYGQYLSNLIFPLYALYEALPAQTQHELREKYGVPTEGNQFFKLAFALFENIEALQAEGVIKVQEDYLAQVIKYRSILALMGNFFAEMSGNPQKDTPFPQAELRRLLQETGVSTVQ